MRIKFYAIILAIFSISFILSACFEHADSISALPPSSDASNATESKSDSLETTSSSVEDNVDIPTAEESVIPINPFNGLYTDEKFQADMRPIAIMVNNIEQSLPQRGLTEADIIYEIVTEGGITRLMAIYSDGFDLPTIGPVRSARDQHIQLMLSYQPLYLHIGSSAPADNMLALYQYANRDIDGKIISDSVWYDSERANLLSQLYTNVDEHCWFTDGETISSVVEDYNFDANVLEQPDPVFNFLSPEEERTPSIPVDSFNIKFSEYSTSSFEYNSELGKYEKSIYAEPQIDANNDEQLAFKNVFVLFTTISTYPDGVLADVQYNFGGVGYYFSNGGYERIRWLKGSPEDPLRIVSSDGKETPIEVNPGNSYVAVVDLSHFSAFAEFEMS